MRILRSVLIASLVWIGLSLSSQAEIQTVLQANQAAVERASRKTIDTVLEALVAASLPETQAFLEAWQAKDVWMRKEDKLFFFVTTQDKKTYQLLDLTSGEPVGEAAKKELKQLKVYWCCNFFISAL